MPYNFELGVRLASEQDYTISRHAAYLCIYNHRSLSSRSDGTGYQRIFGCSRNHSHDGTYALAYKSVPLLVEPLTYGQPEANGVDLSLLKHISPIEWDNVVLYGEYHLNKRLIKP